MSNKKSNIFRDKINLVVYSDLIVLLGILILVTLIEIITDFDSDIINWLYKNDGSMISELAVNGMMAALFLGIYIVRRTIAYKKLLQKQLESESILKTSRKQLEMLLDNSATVVYTAQPGEQSGDSYISGNVKVILGYEPEEFKQTNFWFDIIHPEDKDRVSASFPSFYEQGYGENEFRIKHKDGSWRWIFNKMKIVTVVEGQAKEMVGSWLDITERKKAQEAIRKSEERFQLAAAATKDVIYDWDLRTNIAWVNDQHYFAFGYPHEGNTTVGNDWWKTKLHPDDRDRIKASMKRTHKENKSTWTEEYRFRRADGSYANVLDRSMITYSPNGKAIHCVGTIADLSELKHTEFELRQAKEKAEVSAKAKSEFLANMSHEIRTPLNGIIGMTDMILETTDLTANQNRYLKIIKSSSDTLIGLINDILDFSKIDAGKLQLSPAPFSLRDEIPRSLQALSLKAAEKGLEFIYRLDQNVPDEFIGDVLRLQQILINLAGNAIKFTEKGEVDLHIELESVIKDEATLHFVISDTGIGIPKHKLSEIFQEFSQADGSTSRKYGGTGLGLSITKRLVEMMDGKVWVDSEEGKGSAFHFTIKLKSAHGEQVHRFTAGPMLENSKVLIVESNKITSEHTCNMLRHFKMRPIVVLNAVDALFELKRSAALQQLYPVVLLEIALPGALDGFDLAESIKMDKDLKGTEIIVITMSQKASDRERFASLGVTEFFSKPFSQSDLLDSLQNILAGNKTLLNEDHNEPINSNDTSNQYVVTPQGGLKILLAEDNKINQEVAVSMLTRQGYAVRIANNGEEAVKALRNESYDLVLMDVQMPLMNGYEATQKIRQIEQSTGQRVPIIGLTANAMNGDRQKCIDAGMDDYLAKPVNMKTLLATVAKMHKGSGDVIQNNISDNVSQPGPVDREKLLQQLGSSKKTLTICMNLFNQETPSLVSMIEIAVSSKNLEDAQSAFHDLRGSLITMEMTVAAKTAADLAMKVDQQKFTEVERSLPLLKMEIKKATEYINEIL